MRKTLPYSLAIGALLLVGAGCGFRQEAQVDTQAEVGAPDAMMDKDAMKADGSVDASVEAILDGMEEEDAEGMEAEKDADDVDATSGEVNTLIESDYEVK
jgi:hypothetical protein